MSLLTLAATELQSWKYFTLNTISRLLIQQSNLFALAKHKIREIIGIFDLVTVFIEMGYF